MYLIGMLVLLFLANIAMLMGMTNWPQRTREGFTDAVMNGSMMNGNNMMKGNMMSGSMMNMNNSMMSGVKVEPFADVKKMASGAKAESFMDYLSNGFATAPIGSYDGINMAANLPPAAQGFRARLPNEPLAGPEITIDNDHLFLFANNQCKPECCGATLSCDGGCVCSSVSQKNFINSRGGNRLHDDGF
jgi:hypothetical protein